MSTWQYRDSELTTQQRCPLLPPHNIPYAVQDDFSSTADDVSSVNVLDLGTVNDEFKVTQRSPKSWKLKYRDFVPAPTISWNKSETFQ